MVAVTCRSSQGLERRRDGFAYPGVGDQPVRPDLPPGDGDVDAGLT